MLYLLAWLQPIDAAHQTFYALSCSLLREFVSGFNVVPTRDASVRPQNIAVVVRHVTAPTRSRVIVAT